MALNRIAGGKACNHQLSEARYSLADVVGRTISHYKVTAELGPGWHGGWPSATKPAPFSRTALVTVVDVKWHGPKVVDFLEMFGERLVEVLFGELGHAAGGWIIRSP